MSTNLNLQIAITGTLEDGTVINQIFTHDDLDDAIDFIYELQEDVVDPSFLGIFHDEEE